VLQSGLRMTSAEDYESELFRRALAIAPEVASRYGVRPDVHPQDFIFRFILTQPRLAVLENAVDYYFGDGARSAARLRLLLEEICGWRGRRIDLLEFASGYGCVSRHLAKILPEVNVTSCDIHAAALEFLSHALGLRVIPSTSVPEQFIAPEAYDAIFALSFFSHMPKQTWGRWLRALMSRLKPGGALIFTTHGLVSLDRAGGIPLDSDGFGFVPASEQKDLDTAEYGGACTAPAFVFREASVPCDGRIVYFREGVWWEHQDLYVVKRHPVTNIDTWERQRLAGNSRLMDAAALTDQIEELQARVRDLEAELHGTRGRRASKLYRFAKKLVGR